MREIRYEVADGVATLTIDRPEKRGAMTYAMLDEFSAGVARAGADPDVAVLLVTGVPGSFCAGIDLADLASRSPDDRGRRDWDDPGDPLLMGCPKPVVAAVDGMAVGMGAEFATQADLRVVVEPEALRHAALDLAEAIATASPFALVRTKKLMLDGAGALLRAHVRATRTALAECFASADHAEGVAAFLERRPARFTGR